MKIESIIKNKIEGDIKLKQELLDKQEKQNEIVATAFKKEILAKIVSGEFSIGNKIAESYTLHFNNLLLPETLTLDYYKIPCEKHLFRILSNEFEDFKIESLKIDDFYNNDRSFHNISISICKK